MTNDLNYPEAVTDIDRGDNNAFVDELKNLIKEYEHKSSLVETTEGSLAEAKRDLKQLIENTIPEHMGATTDWKGDGYRVEVKPNLFCTIPKENIAEAVKHLESIGQGLAVKRRISLDFGSTLLTADMIDTILPKISEYTKGLMKQQLEEANPESGVPYSLPVDVEAGYTVNAQTLKKIAREQKAEGYPMPEDVYNTYHCKKAVVNQLKK